MCKIGVTIINIYVSGSGTLLPHIVKSQHVRIGVKINTRLKLRQLCQDLDKERNVT